MDAIVRFAQDPSGYNYIALKGDAHFGTTSQDFNCDPVNLDNVRQDVVEALKPLNITPNVPFKADKVVIAQAQDAILQAQMKWRASANAA